MKRTVLSLLLFGILCSYSIGENHEDLGSSTNFHNIKSTFNKNDFVLNFGLGLGTNLFPMAHRSHYSAIVPPLSISAEYGIVDNIFIEKMTLGVGGIIGYSYSEYRSTYFWNTYKYNYTYIAIGLRGAVHYPLVENFDVHAGVTMGANIQIDHSRNVTDPRPLFGMYIGGRYYLTNNFAGMAEIGYGLSYLNIGFALKF